MDRLTEYEIMRHEGVHLLPLIRAQKARERSRQRDVQFTSHVVPTVTVSEPRRLPVSLTAHQIRITLHVSIIMIPRPDPRLYRVYPCNRVGLA